MMATTLQDRKAQLLLEGAIYRVGIVRGKAATQQAMHTKAPLFHAIEQVLGLGAGTRIDSVLPVIDQLQTLTPLVIATGSFLSRKRLLKPAIGLGLIIVLATAYRSWQRRSEIQP